MTSDTTVFSRLGRTRWAAIGAAIAVSLGAGGGFGLASAVQESGERATDTPISPSRLSDTRTSNQIGPRNTPIGADETYTIAARGEQGKCSAADLPADATALVLNVTALGATSQSFLTFWPDGDRPEAASLNPSVGAPPIPNAVTTQLAGDGSFKIYNERGSVNVVIDVAGFYTDHNHDDRYYTREEADAAFGGAVVDGYTKAETDAAIQAADDALLELLVSTNGPIKVNIRDIEANKNHIEAERTVAINRHAFHPESATGTRDIDKGVYITSAASLNELWAPVDIPFGAIITGIRARVIDDTGGASLGVQLYEVGNTGGVSAVSTEATTLGLSSSGTSRSIIGSALTRNDSNDSSYEVRIRANQGNFWSTVTDDIQVIGVFVDYEMEVEEVT